MLLGHDTHKLVSFVSDLSPAARMGSGHFWPIAALEQAALFTVCRPVLATSGGAYAHLDQRYRQIRSSNIADAPSLSSTSALPQSFTAAMLISNVVQLFTCLAHLQLLLTMLPHGIVAGHGCIRRGLAALGMKLELSAFSHGKK